jgi:hypothetical protein
MTVYRGIHPAVFGKDIMKLKGATIEDPSFMSTSPEQRVAERFGDVIMSIRVPKGHKNLDVSEVLGDTAEYKERERIMPRGTKVVVDGVVQTSRGILGMGKRYTIRCHVVI